MINNTYKSSILLIFPPYSNNISFQTSPPLGINFLASYLAEQGFKAKAFDFNLLIITAEKLLKEKSDNKSYNFASLFPDVKSIADCLKEKELPEMAKTLYLSCFELSDALSYDVIGFSVAFAHQLPRAAAMARLIRELKPEIKIVIGGSQITLLTEKQLTALAKSSLFDFIICGEGENVLPKILKQEVLPKIIKASCSFQDFKKTKPTDFLMAKEYVEPLFLPILIGRGCHWGKCSFCDYKRLSSKILIRTPENVFEEIIYHNEKLKPKGFILISDAIPHNWYLQLAKLALDNKILLRTAGYMLHDKQLDDNFFETLNQAGVYEINFGTESLNDRILKLMNKKTGYQTIEDNLKAASQFNIIISVNIMADFPSISFTEAMEVADKIEELAPFIDCLNVQYFDLTYDCEIFNNPDKFAITINQKPPIASSHGFHSFGFKRKTPFTTKETKAIKKRYYDLVMAIKQKASINQKVKDYFLLNG